MKKILFLTALIFASGILTNYPSRANSENKSIIAMKEKNDGEKIFIEHADKCLALIDKAAQKMAVKGVAVVAFIPGDAAKSWISKMKVVGVISNGGANYLAVAYSKAAEMAETYKDSGSADRESIIGEFGWQGGVIKKVNPGYILATFSGATGEQDVELAKEGLDCLYEYY